MRQDAESNWVPQTQFTEFTYWKHGVDPLRKDSAQRRLDYLKVCQQVRQCSGAQYQLAWIL